MIDSYDFGKIVIDGKEYIDDVIIYPTRVDEKWWRRSGHELCLDDIKSVLDERPDVVVVGTGYFGAVKVLQEVKNRLRSEEIELIAQKTSKACETYNNLAREKRRVIATLHLTC